MAFGHGSDCLLFRSCPGHVLGKSKNKSLQIKERIGAAFLGTYDVPDTIQWSDSNLPAVVCWKAAQHLGGQLQLERRERRLERRG